MLNQLLSTFQNNFALGSQVQKIQADPSFLHYSQKQLDNTRLFQDLYYTQSIGEHFPIESILKEAPVFTSSLPISGSEFAMQHREFFKDTQVEILSCEKIETLSQTIQIDYQKSEKALQQETVRKEEKKQQKAKLELAEEQKSSHQKLSTIHSSPQDIESTNTTVPEEKKAKIEQKKEQYANQHIQEKSHIEQAEDSLSQKFEVKKIQKAAVSTTIKKVLEKKEQHPDDDIQEKIKDSKLEVQLAPMLSPHLEKKSADTCLQQKSYEKTAQSIGISAEKSKDGLQSNEKRLTNPATVQTQQVVRNHHTEELDKQKPLNINIHREDTALSLVKDVEPLTKSSKMGSTILLTANELIQQPQKEKVSLLEKESNHSLQIDKILVKSKKKTGVKQEMQYSEKGKHSLFTGKGLSSRPHSPKSIASLSSEGIPLLDIADGLASSRSKNLTHISANPFSLPSFAQEIVERFQQGSLGQNIRQLRFRLFEQHRGEIHLRLDPQHLGLIRISLNLNGNQLTGSIIADQVETTKALQEHLQHIKNSLEEGGLIPSGINVSLGSESHQKHNSRQLPTQSLRNTNSIKQSKDADQYIEKATSATLQQEIHQESLKINLSI